MAPGGAGAAVRRDSRPRPDEGGEPVQRRVDLIRPDGRTGQPQPAPRIGVVVEVPHRNPQHTELPPGLLQRGVVGGEGHIDHDEESAGRPVPAHTAALGEPGRQTVQQPPQIALVHGGPQLDRTVPALTALPAVRDAVAGRCAVLLDGGVRSGSDILCALARDALGLLADELTTTLTMSGCHDLTDARALTVSASCGAKMATQAADTVSRRVPGAVRSLTTSTISGFPPAAQPRSRTVNPTKAPSHRGFSWGTSHCGQSSRKYCWIPR
ncbi:alpha-hydroxy-acid oxidizing protein [Saccharomonospora piscinae]|uniref:alpha-hydroxy-acid oxidizing protein n=1 Tax=Saccharomonospora piscinae TaxID=687388 RepID=UPI0009BCC17C